MRRFLAGILLLFLSVYVYAQIGGIVTFPEGSSGEVQFEQDGSFGGDSQFAYDETTHQLTVSTVQVNGNITATGTVSTAGLNAGPVQNSRGFTVSNDNNDYIQVMMVSTTDANTALRGRPYILLSGTTFFLIPGGSTSPAVTLMDGNVGIGTTSPLASLHVVGDSALGTSILSNGAAGTNPTFQRYLVSGTSKLLLGAAAGNNNFGLGITTGDAFMVTPTTSSGIGFYSGQSIATGPNLFVKTSNLDPRVGVGTTSPSYRLQVSSGLGETGTLFAVSTGAVDLFKVAGTSVVLKVPLYFPDGTSQTTAGGGGSSQWTTNGSSIGYTTGWVGIGTTAPVYPLHINTAAQNTIADFQSSGGSSYVQIDAAAGANETGFKFSINNSLTGGVIYTPVAGGGGVAGLKLLTSSGTEMARLTSTGLGIGTSGPSYLLHVSSAAGETGTVFAVSTGTVDLFKVAGTSAVLKVPLYADLINVSTVGYSFSFNPTFNVMNFTAPTNRGFLSSNARWNLSNDSSANTSGGGTLLNLTYNKVWTINDSTGGTGGQSLYGGMGGAYDWFAHANMTGVGEMGYVAGVHGTNQTGFAVTVTSTKSYGFQGYVSTTTDNDFMAFHANVNALDYLYPNLQGTPTPVGTFTGKWINIYSPTSPLLSIANWDYLGDIIAATGTFTGSTFSIGGSTVVVTGGRLGVGTAAPTSQITIKGLPGGSGYLTVASSAAAHVVNLGCSDTLGGFCSEGTTSASTFLLQTGGTNALAINGTTQRVGIGTIAPSYMLHVATTAASTGVLFAVSTGSVDLFSVIGTSISIQVPLNMNSAPIQNVGSISGSGSGRISLVDTSNSSMTFVTSGGTHTLTTQGFVTSATTAEIGNTSNLIALQLGASSATFNENMRSTGTVTATKFIDSSSNIVAKGTQTWVFEITTGTLAAGSTWQIGIAPDDTAITITRVRAASFSVAASTINFSLWGRSTPNGANTTIFNNTISSGCWTETSTTTFSSNSIAAGSGLYFSPPSGGATFQAGTTSGLKIIVDYLFAQ